jgi:hypothetical protein
MNVSKWLSKVAVALAVASLVMPGCGSSQTRESASAAQDSAKSLSADALLADAMQRQAERRDISQTLALVRKAAEKAPARADITWLYSQLCAQAPECRPEPIEAHLRSLDPDNAAGWIAALERAREQQDTAAENRVLEAMSRSERFDIYWNQLVSKIATARGVEPLSPGATTPDPLTANLNETIGWVSSIAVPRFAPIAESCSTQRIGNPATAARCRAVAEVLTRGDSYIAESVGLGIAERLAPPGSPEAVVVAERIERSRYQRDTAGQIVAFQIERDRFSREMLELMTSLRREQDVFLAVIRWAGQPIEPQG